MDYKDHVLLEIDDIVEHVREFMLKDRVFVESSEINLLERAKTLFIPQHADNNSVIDNALNLKGFESTNKHENTVTLLIEESYDNKIMIEEAAERLNGMCLRDEQGRLVRVKIQTISLNT